MAEIECRSVQVLRPSSSTSGGQSVRGPTTGAKEEVVLAAVVAVLKLPAESFFFDTLAMAIQSAAEVHERHLGGSLLA